MAAAKKNQETKGVPFFNRELSWLEFQKRVLNEALDGNTKPLERLKFLCIVSSNFDEFFQVRVAALKRQVLSGDYSACPAGMSPPEQIAAIFRETRKVSTEQYRCLHEDVFPELAKNGLVFLHPRECREEQSSFLGDLFEKEIFPALTPVRVEEGAPFPSAGNLNLHAAFLLEPREDVVDGREGPRVAVVRVPSSLPRILYLPGKDGRKYFTLLEYVVLDHAFRLFPG